MPANVPGPVDGVVVEEVPIVDIAPFRLGDDEDRRRIADAVALACEEIGFLTISGHGVAEELIVSTRDAALRFFDLPLEQKEVASPAQGLFRGYRSVESTKLAASLGQETPPDLKEVFIVGSPAGDDEYYTGPGGRPFFAETPWPPRPADFRERVMAYYRRLEDLGVLLRRIFATALDLPEDWFEDKWQRHTSLLSLVHYPAQEGTPAPGQLRAGAHADYGSFTMLQKDPGEASLQVLRKDGEWVDVVPPAGTFVINIGDQLAQWTNDRWVSTKHRVINPTGEAARRRRLSMAFFCQPDYDAAVAPLTRPDEEPRYAPTTAGEILLSKFRKSTGMEE